MDFEVPDEGFDQDYPVYPDDEDVLDEAMLVEAKFKMKNVYGYNELKRVIDLLMTVELIWTDPNLALCDCVRNSSDQKSRKIVVTILVAKYL